MNLKEKSYKLAAVVLAAATVPGMAAAVTNQSEGAVQDNFDQTNYDFEGYHNRMQDSSDQLEPGAATERNWNLSDVFGTDYRVYESRDSMPGPDNWALTKHLNYSIGNRGQAKAPALDDRSGCYYRPGVVERRVLMEAGDTKKQKFFGNSIAVARDWEDPDNDGVAEGDGAVEGVWEDPDDPQVRPTLLNFSCDITGFDKGIGVDNGTDDDGEFRFENNNPDTNVSIGDIAFVDQAGKSDTFEQEPPVCGDDHKEYLVEELGESANSMNRSGSFACSGRRDVCVARHGGQYAVYRDGDLVETDEASEDFGRSKNDMEVCETQGVNTRFGVWYDQDYSKEYCQANTLYGDIGVRWFNASFVDKHPYAVREGLDDDMNPYLYNRGRYNFTSTQGDVSYGAGETPVPTGRNVSGDVADYYSEYKNNPDSVYNNQLKDLVYSKGFCAGDDSDENLIVQESSTSLIDTNYSVIAVADSSGDCVLDGANYPDKVPAHDDRKVYSTGEKVTVDLGPTQRQIACYAGQWHADWPVVFLSENVSVESGTTGTAEFQIINVQDSETEFEVTLDVPTRLEPHTEFSQGGVQFTTTLPAEETNIYSVDIFGYNESVDSAEINVSAETSGSGVRGSDHTTLDIVDTINQSQGLDSANQTASEVPGIGPVQLLALLMAAYIFYMQTLLKQ